MELRIEHLKGYLGTGLKFQVPIHEIHKTAKFENRVFKLTPDNFNLCISNGKLHLYPLSSLTEFREDLGFVPLEKLISMAIDEYDDKEGCFTSNNITYFEAINNNSIDAYFFDNLKFRFTYNTYRELFSLYTPQGGNSCFGLKYIQKIYEWHIDIHNLIENNLAIDKRTLK